MSNQQIIKRLQFVANELNRAIEEYEKSCVLDIDDPEHLDLEDWVEMNNDMLAAIEAEHVFTKSN